jgi:O-methyltransferase involved in polyketide biosynthesis
MTRDDIIRLAREANISFGGHPMSPLKLHVEELQLFAALVSETKRERVAKWMIEQGYATDHCDTVEDCLKALEWQIREREREACALIAESYEPRCDTCPSGVANAIRARGESK